MTVDLFENVVQGLYDGVYIVDMDGGITYWNDASRKLTGYSAEEVLGKRCSEGILNHVDAAGHKLCLEGCPLRATREDGETREAEVFLHHKEGHRLPVRVRATPLRDDTGAIVGGVEVFSDNREKMSLTAELESLRQQALVDALTELPNRRYGEMVLASRLHDLQRHGLGFGLLLADVDHFKKVNDTHGHEAGDRVLQLVAHTMASTCRGTDVVIRWGGEEFVIVVARADTRDKLTIAAERYRELVAASHYKGDTRLGATISIGGAVAVPRDTLSTLVTRADERLYAAKLAGRNRSEIEP